MEEKPNYYSTSTEQNNQLRIALITISAGLVAFFGSELNHTVSWHGNSYLYLTIIFSLLACASGLAAWKCSAQSFYQMGLRQEKEGAKPETDCKKKTSGECLGATTPGTSRATFLKSFDAKMKEFRQECKKKPYHGAKVILDLGLIVLLLMGATFAAVHLLHEKEPASTNAAVSAGSPSPTPLH